MDDETFDELDETYQEYRQRDPLLRFAMPIVVLLVVVGIISGLVFGGVVQGDEARPGVEASSTTVSTVIIQP